MESFYAAAQNRGIRRHVLYLLALIAQRFDKLLSTSRTHKLDALVVELLQQLVEAILVEYRHQSGLNLLCFSHLRITLYVHVYKTGCKDNKKVATNGIPTATFLQIQMLNCLKSSSEAPIARR